MRNFVRWTGFTLAIVLFAMIAAFAMLYFGRLYGGGQSPAAVFSALGAFCIVVTLAAIAFAAKLDEEDRRDRL